MPISILMPALSPTMEEGTLAKWLVAEGDNVASGDLIAEIETDKATMEVEAIDEGTVGKLLIAEGTENVQVNEVIALILEEGEDKSALDQTPAPVPTPAPAAESQPTAPTPVAPTPAPAPPAAPASGERVFASPLARRIAADNDIDITQVPGSGPHGRIVKSDVEEAIASGGTPASAKVSTPAIAPGALGFPEGSFDLVKLDGMRKTVAKRLTESKTTVPHFYLSIDCELDNLLAVRKKLNARAPEGEGAYKISVNDLIIKASAFALMRVPAANASWSDEGILMHHHADIAVAVAIDGGLITPIIREAESAGLADIANQMKDLAARARERKLKPEEFQGGTFSISNLGMFGITEFSAVINPPHGAILAVGAGQERAIVRDGALAIATVMTVTLSCDHRVVDGSVGAEFLSAFKGFIEDPVTMLL